MIAVVEVYHLCFPGEYPAETNDKCRGTFTGMTAALAELRPEEHWGCAKREAHSTRGPREDRKNTYESVLMAALGADMPDG